METRLKYFRDKKNLDQKELAEIVGVNVRTISQWENGKNEMTAINLIKLCEALECSPNMLLGWDDSNELSSSSEEESALLRKWRLMDEQAKSMTMSAVDAAQPKKRAGYPVPEEGIA